MHQSACDEFFLSLDQNATHGMEFALIHKSTNHSLNGIGINGGTSV
jgi:hypothetical protein